jgi:hypothetical protein
MAAARHACDNLGGALHIISAGLSIVGPKRRIPSYDLTVGEEGPNPFGQLRASATASDWWRSLNRAFGYGNPLARLIKHHDTQALIALPASYLLMVRDELEKLVATHPNHIRLITSASLEALGSDLSRVAIRYDARLNSVRGGPHGANTSFVQRALLHFSCLLSENPRISAVKSQQLLVDSALRTVSIKKPKARRRAQDTELKVVIAKTLKHGEVSPSQLLRQLRDVHGLSCEQKRFFRIYAAVAADFQ